MNILITGARDSGKTALARELSKRLKGCGGIYTEASYLRGRKSVYHAVHVLDGTKRTLLTLTKNGPRPDLRGFVFAQAALAMSKNMRAIMLDEFGPLEASGTGFRTALNNLIPVYRGNWIITTRKTLLFTVIDLFGFSDFELIDMDVTDLDTALRKTTCLLK